jgi:hypothetical protein
VFVHEEKQVFPVDRDDTEIQLFLSRYGIAPTQGFFKHTLDALRLEAQEHGEPTEVHSFVHYDAKQNVLYLFDHARHVYRITPDFIKKVDNGTDGVVFVRDPKAEPFTLGIPTGNWPALSKPLLGSIHLREDYLTRGEQEWLFQVWLYSVFFPALFPTRVILALIGEKGSGKTSVLRRVGQLFFGQHFQVMQLSNDPRDFDAAVTAEAFVGIDNADQPMPWLDDRLAVLATGATLKRRLYYTTNKLVEFPVTAFVGITSRTPQFTREDVADRLLLFNVERLKQFDAEAHLLQQLQAHRDDLLTELVGQLQDVLKALRDQKGKRYPTKFRIADFGEFALKVAHAADRGAAMEAILDKLRRQQLDFTAQDDPLLDLLDKWLGNPMSLGKEISTAELFYALHALVSTMEFTTFSFKDAKAFGQHLANLKGTLRTLYGTTERTGSQGKRLWTFRHRRGEGRGKSGTNTLVA